MICLGPEGTECQSPLASIGGRMDTRQTDPSGMAGRMIYQAVSERHDGIQNGVNDMSQTCSQQCIKAPPDAHHNAPMT